MEEWIPQKRYELTGREVAESVDFGKRGSSFDSHNEICLSRLRFSREFDEGQRVRVQVIEKSNGLSEILSMKASVHYVTPTLLNAGTKPINILFASDYDIGEYHQQVERFWGSVDSESLYELVLKELAKR